MVALANWPLPSYQGRNPVVSSGFGKRGAQQKMHSGADMDYRAVDGDPPYTGKYTADRTPNYFGPAGVPVLAAAFGKVVVSTKQPNARGVVEISHPGSPGEKMVRTIYRHLSSRFVQVGDFVEAGARLGIMGASASVPFRHLHFAVRKDGKLVDPKPFLQGAKVLTPAATLAPKKKDDRPSTSPATIRKAGFGWLILIAMYIALKRR